MRGAWDMRRCLYRIIMMGVLLCFIFANVTSVHAIAPTPRVDLDQTVLEVKENDVIVVSGSVTLSMGQKISAYIDYPNNPAISDTTVPDTGEESSFQIQIPANKLKLGSNDIIIKSEPVTGRLNGSNPKHVTINVSAQPQPQPVVKNPLFGVTLKKVTKGKRSFTAKWKKASKKQQKQFSGYQIQYSTSPNFTTGVKTKSTTKKKASKVVIRKLKAKTNYYVRIRRFKKAGSNVIYSDWSMVKRVRTK